MIERHTGNTFIIRNVSDEVFFAVKAWAKAQDRTVEGALRVLLDEVARPDERIKIGTLLKLHTNHAVEAA